MEIELKERTVAADGAKFLSAISGRLSPTSIGDQLMLTVRTDNPGIKAFIIRLGAPKHVRLERGMLEGPGCSTMLACLNSKLWSAGWRFRKDDVVILNGAPPPRLNLLSEGNRHPDRSRPNSSRSPTRFKQHALRADLMME